MRRKTAAVLLVFAMVFASVPFGSFAATDIDSPEVYYTPGEDYKSGDCILTATKMMIRRASILRDREWKNITNESLRGPATVAGLLRWAFTVDINGVAYKISHGTFSGETKKARKKEIKTLLSDHPEGIVVHGSYAAKSGPHGVLAVRVADGTVYVADAARNTGSVNYGIQKWADSTMLNDLTRATSYWYIAESGPGKTVNGSVNGTEVSKLRITSYKVPSVLKKGYGFTVKGKVKSNKKINKVVVRIVDLKGNVKYSATRKPNKKSYNINKVDAKIKFSKLKKGSYKYQVIARDSVQKLTLINKRFTVR